MIHPEGLTSSAGSQNFMDRGYSSRLASGAGRARLSLSARWKHLLEAVGLRRPKNAILTIPTITLDAFVRRVGRPIDLLQMDVQGLEVEVLKGASREPENGCREILSDRHARPGARAHSA